MIVLSDKLDEIFNQYSFDMVFHAAAHKHVPLMETVPDECVKNNVQVDYFPYPCHEHNVSGKDRVHLNDKIVLYFEDYL